MQKKVTAEQFIRVWQTSSSPVEVSKRLDMTYSSVNARAADYRKKGIPLKSFKHNRSVLKLNIDELKQLASELAPDNEP